mgnify:CR=1 FL=1
MDHSQEISISRNGVAVLGGKLAVLPIRWGEYCLMRELHGAEAGRENTGRDPVALQR